MKKSTYLTLLLFFVLVKMSFSLSEDMTTLKVFKKSISNLDYKDLEKEINESVRLRKNTKPKSNNFSAPPVAVCKNITVQLDDTGYAYINALDIDGGSTDDIAITSYFVDIESFNCSNIGSPVSVTLFVQDGENQMDSCTAEVTVLAQKKPTGVNASIITNSNTSINWDTQPSFNFDLRYKEVGDAVWTDILNITGSSRIITSLTPNTSYEVEIRSNCSGVSASEYTNAISFTTEDYQSYCELTSNFSDEEYIGRVQFNTIDNYSDGQNYSSFIDISTTLVKGSEYGITLTPIWTDIIYDEFFIVWIDYNNDGDFQDANEEVFSGASTSGSIVSGTITIPVNTISTSTTMRISMNYDPDKNTCGSFGFGEVEEYSLNIVDPTDLVYTNGVWSPYAPSNLTATDNAIILDGTYTIPDAIEINNLSVEHYGDITVEKTGSLIVRGKLTTSNDVTLESDSDEFSSLIVDQPVAGDVHYRRHVNSSASSGGNDLVAPPVFGQTFLDFRSANPNLLSNGANTLFLFGPFDKVSDSYLLYSSAEKVALKDGMGYRAASTDTDTFIFTGSVRTENVDVHIIKNEQSYAEWNLIGNPYPSYIKLSDFLSENINKLNSLRSGIYGYDGNVEDGWTIWNQAYSDANPDAKITPGQGFYVASATSNETIEFKPSMRTTGTGDDFILGRQTNTTTPISHLELKMSNDSHEYKTDFYFTNNATLGLDPGYDSGLFGSPHSFSLYSHLVEDHTGINFTIQSIGPDNLSSVVIPLGVHVLSGVQATLNITKRTLPDDVDVYLEDRLNNTFTLLNTSEYTFTADTDLSGTGRFYMTFAETSLSVSVNETSNDVKIFAISQPKVLHINGQLFGKTAVNIYDIQGRLVNTATLNDGETTNQIDVSSMAKGIYVVHLKNNSQEKTEKVLIN